MLSLAHHPGRVGGLVSAHNHHHAYPCIQASLSNILCTENVGLHSFPGIALAKIHMLHGGSMENNLHAHRRFSHGLAITHISNPEPQFWHMSNRIELGQYPMPE